MRYAPLLALCLVSIPLAGRADLVATVSTHTLSPDETHYFSLGELAAGEVAIGITTPIAGVTNDFDTPDTVVATFLEDDVLDGPPDFFFTANDDSDADNNLGDDSYGSLYRLQAPATEQYTVAVTGSPVGSHSEQGKYVLTRATLDPSVPGGDFADNDATNGTLAGADTLSLAQSVAQAAVNTLSGTGDVDYYRVDLLRGDVLTVMTAPLADLNDSFDDPDTMILMFDGAGNLLFDDDEAGGDFSDFGADTFGVTDAHGSALHFYTPADGTYYFAVTGYDDSDGLGLHGESGDYALLASRISAVPEVNFLGAMGVATLLGAAGRRRRSSTL